MNVEMFFIKTENRIAISAYIVERLQAPPDMPDKQPNWGLARSYDAILAKESKRKVALSPVQNGWIAAIESKEVLDFKLLQIISERLDTEVIACQLANVVDFCGYARCCGGRVLEKRWLENAPDPLETLRSYLKKSLVPFDLLTFREAVQLRNDGWEIIQKKIRN